MIESWTAALERTELAGMLRESIWAYPLINAGHILGVALLVGAIVPLDLRLLGLWRSLPVGPLARVLTRTAGIGLGLAIFFGMFLFITRATEYAASRLFIAKMVVVGTGTLNALVLHATLPDARRMAPAAVAEPPARVRLAACVSLAAWVTALTLGRLIGYF